MSEKVSKDAAEFEFLRFVEAMAIDVDTSTMDDDDLKSYEKQKGRIISAIMAGSLVINDNGEPVFTPALAATAPPSTAATDQHPSGIDLLLAAGATLAVAALGCLVLGERRKQPVIMVRWVLLAIIGGMLGYILYALRLVRPESWGILPDAGWAASAAMVTVVAVCALLPLVVMMRKSLRNRGGRP